MNKAVKALLAVAIILAEKHGENSELKTGIEALQALGENATHSNSEYTSLKAITDAIEVADGKPNAGDDAKEPTRTPNPKQKKDTKKDTKKVEDAGEDVRYKMDGIRMIGSKYYSKKDGYKESFGTAVECAKKFNDKKEVKK
jgi:hypothetical protein